VIRRGWSLAFGPGVERAIHHPPEPETLMAVQHRTRCALAVGLALLVCLGCARPVRTGTGTGTQPAAGSDQAQAPLRDVPLRVENNSRSDVVIYVLRGSVRTRLGTVTPVTSQTFAISGAIIGDQGGISLLADPVAGGRSLVSQNVYVRPGQRLVWTLESRLDRSLLAVH